MLPVRVEDDPRALEAKLLRESGLSIRQVAAEFGVSKSTIQRWTNRETLVRNRASSRAAKEKRGHGQCIDCGGPTSVSKGHRITDPFYFHLRCLKCSIIEQKGKPNPRRGKGTTQARVFNYLSKNGPSYYSVMRDNLKVTNGLMSQLLHRMVRHGFVVRLNRGLYALPGQADEWAVEKSQQDLRQDFRQ